ncbi:MAG: hypothetical protein WDN48_00110 [Pseudolabrys sp.]
MPTVTTVAATTGREGKRDAGDQGGDCNGAALVAKGTAGRGRKSVILEVFVAHIAPLRQQ